jgi:DNA-directed RNA polymerase specialized sigma24 family protein
MEYDDKVRITEILSIWKESKDKALFDVFSFDEAYKDLQRIARKAKREMLQADSGDIKCTEGILNNLFIELSERKSLDPDSSKFYGFENRAKFYSLCRMIIRGILNDFLKKSSNKNEDSTDYQSEMITERVKRLSLEKFKSDLSYQELCLLAEDALSKIAELSEKFKKAVEMFRLKIDCDCTNEEIAEEYKTNETKVTRNITLIRARLRCEIGKYKPIIDKAVQITNTTQRNIFIKESYPDDKNLLRHLEVILKQIRNEKG